MTARRVTSRGVLSRRHLSHIVLFVLVLGVLLIAINVFQLQLIRHEHELHHGVGADVEGQPEALAAAEHKPPVVWVVAKHVSSTSASNQNLPFLLYRYIYTLLHFSTIPDTLITCTMCSLVEATSGRIRLVRRAPTGTCCGPTIIPSQK